MVLKTTALLALPAALCVGFILLQDPFLPSLGQMKLSFASLQASNIAVYELENKVLGVYEAKEYKRLGKRDELEDLRVRRANLSLKAPLVIAQDEAVYFPSRSFVSNAEYELNSECFFYKDKKLEAQCEVRLNTLEGQNKGKGSALSYLVDEGKLYVRDVKLWLD